MAYIPHSKPSINTQDITAVSAVLKSGALVQGAHVEAFEKHMSRFVGVKYAVAVNSGTSALHLALLGLGIGPGDEVIIPAFVCAALINAVSYTGAIAVIADVKYKDFNIDPLDVKRKLTTKTKAIIVVHMFGYPADLKELSSFGVPLIEDCAQSIGADYMGKKAGAWGIVSICSFYATKVLTTGEGGIVLTSNRQIAQRIRDLRQYDKVNQNEIRYNYKMTDFQAALGLSQLKQLPAFIKRRRAIALSYTKALSKTDFILPEYDTSRNPIYFRFVIKTKKNAKNLIKSSNNLGIGLAHPVFKTLEQNKNCCPVTTQLIKQSISLPIYSELKDAQVKRIINSIIQLFPPSLRSD